MERRDARLETRARRLAWRLLRHQSSSMEQRYATDQRIPNEPGCRVSKLSSEHDDSTAATRVRRRDNRREKPAGANTIDDDKELPSQSMCDLLTAMQSGALTMQDVAEVLTAMQDHELRMFGALLADRECGPMSPRPTPVTSHYADALR